MRVRMLNKPEIIEIINRDLVPVQINATDLGVPDGVPALELWKGLFEGSPWSRFSFGSFVVLDTDGEHSYGSLTLPRLPRGTLSNLGGSTSGESQSPEGIEILKRALARFDEATRLRRVADRDEAARTRLLELDAEIEAEKARMLPCADDPRLLSARFLLSKKSEAALNAMTRDEQGCPRNTTPEVHRMGLAALGRLLTDHRPFAKDAREHVHGSGSRRGRKRAARSRVVALIGAWLVTYSPRV